MFTETGEPTASDRFWVAAPEAESVTFTVNAKVPAAAGVPASAPVALSDRPAGSVPPATDQLYPPEPPVAESVCEYGEPARAPGSEVVVIDGAAMTAIKSEAVAVVELLSLTCTAKLAVPEADGVPEIVPAALRESPAGSDPETTDQLYPPVPPVAESVWE